ncbi:MAG: hypothetical protein JWM32_463 [Verrucomicrobia bacterium]|nr:hypothetical protein [Verrucomicrobiota bacterium]
MKKLLFIVLAALAVAVSARATTLSDNNPADVIFSGIKTRDLDTTTYTGRFDLTGYDPLTMTVDSAWAEFTFFDLLGSESFTVHFTDSLLSPLPDNSVTQGSFFWFLTLGGPLNQLDGTLLLELDSTGSLHYTIDRLTGSFTLTNAYLEAEVSARQVPDGAMTALLLGLGLIGLASFSRLRVRVRLQRVKAS